jgi:multidrug efflux system outer membrane protein
MSKFPSLRGALATWQSSQAPWALRRIYMRGRRRALDCFAALAMTSLLSSCSLAPSPEIPETKTPEAFKEQSNEIKGEWKEIKPLEVSDRGQWWKIFDDEALNTLEVDAANANPSLAAASARVEQARANVRANNSTLFPKIDIGAGASRSQPASAGVAAFGGNPNAQLNPYTLYSAGAVASYEVDLFGRVRDTESAYEAEAKGQEALYKSTLLMLEADVAQQYFTLRSLDAERALLRDTIKVREEAQRIMQKRFDLGEASEQDFRRAEADLSGVQAELLVLDRSRAVYEHALAVLLGKNPSEFTFAEAPLELVPPQIPPSVPSTLLARRPDVSAAISAMEAANKRIGVARTAFLPRLVLSASAGVESLTLSDLLKWSSRTWTLGQLAGDALSMTVFDSGRNIARVDLADAAYKETVAGYRAQVLAAFRDVEDALAAERLMAEQAVKTGESAFAATRTTELVQKRYDEGDVNYFEVVDAQRNSLAASRANVQTRGQRFIAAVSLIRALGGSWGETPVKVEEPASELPKEKMPKVEEPKAETPVPAEEPTAPVAPAIVPLVPSEVL